MKQYQDVWNEVGKLLKEARGYLDTSQCSLNKINDSNFVEYLTQNELELALDELEAISDSFETSKEFWQCLIRSANLMGLDEHSRKYVELCGYNLGTGL